MLDTNKMEEKLLNIVKLCDEHLLGGIDIELDKMVLENGLYYGCKNHLGITSMFKYLELKKKETKNKEIRKQIEETIEELKAYTLLKVYNKYSMDEFNNDPIEELSEVLPMAYTTYEDDENIEMQYDYCIDKEESIITINGKTYVNKVTFDEVISNMLIGGFDSFVYEMNKIIGRG